MNTERYARQLMLPQVGPEGQARLRAASVLLVGAGGLGCPVLQYLAGAGVGCIRLVDGDRVELSNLHRQPLYGMDEIGAFKVEAAARALQRMNPEVELLATSDWLRPDNAPEWVAAADVVIDAGDNRALTYMLSDACMASGKPLVSASALGLEGHVAAYCAGGPSYRALMPDMPQGAANCSTSGVLGTVVATLGTLQAHFALQLILGLEPGPVGRLIRFDAASLRFSEMDFRHAREPAGPQLGFIAAGQTRPDDCIVDLRGEAEAGAGQILPGAHRVLPEHLEQVAELAPRDARVVLCCRSGLRAWWAGRRLQAQGRDRLALLAMGGEHMAHRA